MVESLSGKSETSDTASLAAVDAAATPPVAIPGAVAHDFKPTPTLWLYLGLVAVMYASGLIYAWTHGLSIKALYLYGLLQPVGIHGEEARIAEIPTPLSWNLAEVAWFFYIKGAAVLVELFQC